MPLNVQTVLETQRAEVIFRQCARQIAARLVAELHDPLVDKPLIDFVVDVHATSDASMVSMRLIARKNIVLELQKFPFLACKSMKLQQLRYLREVVRRGLNVSEAAEALFTSQPGISKQIRLLEDELGVQILVRHGKRVVDLTEPGRIILDIADRMLQDAETLRAVGREFGNEDTGTLTIATTPTQA